MEFLQVLLVAGIPAIGNIAGGLAAEFTKPSRKSMTLALHAAVGIVMAVVAVELMPRVLEAQPPWVIILAFVLGGCFTIGFEKALAAILQSGAGGSGVRTGPWMVYLGAAIDLFSDGVMIGTGSTINLRLGLLLALGQAPADFPEGFASVSTFKDFQPARGKRLALVASFAIPILLGTTMGFWVVRGRPDLFKLGLLAFTAGALITVAVERMLSQAHATIPLNKEEAPINALTLIGGFALFTAVSVYFA